MEGQEKQLVGWLDSSMSRMARRAATTLGLLVRMLLPSEQWAEQAVSMELRPRLSISTVQIRQDPSGIRPLIWHRVGIRIPTFSAASRMVVPFSTSTGMPSMVTWIKLMVLSIPPYSTEMALVGQPVRQVPQRIHLDVSMVWGFFTDPVMASTGQLRAHLVQPTHFSWSIT